MKRILLPFVAAFWSLSVWADGYDLNEPFGFCTVTSRTDAGTSYNMTGGGCYTYPIPDDFTGKVIVLKSTGQNMKSTIQNAISQNDVIIFDGSDGDFIVATSVGISTKNKTLLGINNARICTEWFVTDQIKDELTKAGVSGMSTSGGGGTLTNGKKVSEAAEYNTRQIIINLTGDDDEGYRNAGILSLSSNAENIIIRNISFVGPGAIDVGGSDLISCTGAKHCWIDHCDFQDGEDGNFDITNSADFITVSWCTFHYTDRSYMHQNTNLVGSSDNEAQGYLNTTFAFNWWGTGCKQRMPMARAGKIHMLNNYFSCTGASNCINPRKNSEFLIEGNYFASGVSHYYSQSSATAVTWTTNNYIAAASSLPANVGSTVTVPYDYDVAPYAEVPSLVQGNAGATLPFGESTPEPDGTKGSITWPFDTGADGQTASVSTFISAGIASTSVTLGSDLKYDGKQTVNGIDETKIQDLAHNSTGATANNAITFKINIADGYKFLAENVSVTATRLGTDAGKIDISWIDGGGTTILATGQTPKRNSTPSGKEDQSPYYTTYSYTTSNAVATKDACSLVINLYGVTTGYKSGSTTELNYKDYGFANIIINGTLVDPAGISTPVTFSTAADGYMYNLQGQRVDSSYRGIVIQNGKKFLKK